MASGAAREFNDDSEDNSGATEKQLVSRRLTFRTSRVQNAPVNPAQRDRSADADKSEKDPGTKWLLNS